MVLNGRVQSFNISGIALSPEYVYAVKPGLPIPDDRLFAMLWVDRSAAEAAFDMKGAFNDVVVSLAPGADPRPVIAELDRLLEPLWFGRRHRTARSTFQQVSGRRTEPAKGDVDDHSLHILWRRGISFSTELRAGWLRRSANRSPP